MRLEELLGHRCRHAAAPPARQRREDHGRVHVALVIRGENHRAVDAFQILQSVDRGPRKHARERKQECRLADRAHRANRQRPVPGRESTGSGADSVAAGADASR